VRVLPQLAGRSLAAYRLIWAAALLAAVAAAIAGQVVAFAPSRLLQAIVLAGAAALLFKRRPTDPVAAMLSLAFLLWVVTTSPAAAEMDVAAPILALLDRLRFAFFVTAMLLFPAGRFELRGTRMAVAATWLTAAFGTVQVLAELPFVAFILPATSCAIAAVAALAARFRSLPPGVQRQQIKWVALGLATGLVLVAASRLGALLISPMAAAVRGLLFDVGVSAMALGVLVSLLRYRLYDADAAISRSTSYAALTVALVAVFAGSEAVVQALSQSWFGGSAGEISGGIAAALSAALIAPLHQRVTSWTEQRFRKALVTLQIELPKQLDELREVASLEELGEVVLEAIERAVRPVRSAFVVEDRVVATRHIEQESIAAGGEALLPLRLPLAVPDSCGASAILLGPRPDGSRQGADDREALGETAGAISRAVRIVVRREQQSAAEAARLRRVTATVAALEARVASLERSAKFARSSSS
jgi:hypothetical protein